MEHVTSTYSASPLVREFTVNLLRGLPNNDLRGQVNRVTQFVKDNVTYIRDPEGSEYLVSPERMLQGLIDYGFIGGDCDDHVVLLNAMLGTIGIQTKPVGVKFGGSTEFNHVISGVYLPGSFLLIDPCSKGKVQPTYYETLIV